MLRLSVSGVTLVVLASACNTDSGSATAPRAAPVNAARAQPAPPNVTSTIADGDANGSSLLTQSDDFNGSGSATYAPVNGITSHITSDGSWQLYLGGQTARRLYLVLAGQGIPLPDGYYSANVEAYSQCFDQSGVQVSLLLMSLGATNGNCSFGVDFSSGRTKYKLAMSPKFSGTGRASVTCTSVVGGQCTGWLIEPNAGAANAGVASLFHFANNGSLILDGVYRNSFRATAIR